MSSTLLIPEIMLRVSDLEQSRDFYVRRVGFAVVQQEGDRLHLAPEPDATPVLTLIGGARAAVAREAAGLFHAALLLPSREALGNWLTFAAAQEIEFEGFSDHGVSEAIYFSDPDGNGLEFYADRPHAHWPRAEDQLAMTTRPLAIRSLIANAAPTTAPLAGARWGHLHLRVTDLERSEDYYRSTLDLHVTQRSYPGARFLAADHYHHHIGLNVWGNPHQPLSSDAAGLVHAVIARPGFAAEERHTDPDGLELRLVPLAWHPAAHEAVNA